MIAITNAGKQLVELAGYSSRSQRGRENARYVRP
jgi:hypothetical protein